MQKQNQPSLESYPEELPPYEQVMQHTLGRWAVQREDEAAAFSLQKDAAERKLAAADPSDRSAHDMLRSHIESFADKQGLALTSREQLLYETRQRIADLRDDQKHELDNYLDDSASTFLFGLAGREPGPDNETPTVSWSEWLAAQASDEQLVNFLQWHVHTIAEQQSSEVFTERVKEEKRDYKAAVQKGINQGWIHPDAEAALDRVDDIEVYVGDVFDTILRSREAYYTRGTSVVVVGPGNGYKAEERDQDTADTLSAYFKHELNHAVLGYFPYVWLDEAVTENLAEIFNNDAFEKTSNTYDSERKLLNVLLSAGHVKVPTRVVTRAYTDPKGLDGDSYKMFVRALDTAWGVEDVLGRIKNKIQSSIVAQEKAGLKRPRHVLMGTATQEVAKQLRQNPDNYFKEGLAAAA